MSEVLVAGLAAVAALAAARAAGTGGLGARRRPGAIGPGPGRSQPFVLPAHHGLGPLAPPPRLVALAQEAGGSDAWVSRWPGVLAGAGAATVLAGIAAGPFAALVIPAAIVVAPRLAGPPLRRRRLRRRDEQLVPWLERVASGLRAGLSLAGALSAAAPTAPWPLREDLARLEGDIGSLGLAVGLARWAERSGTSPAVTLTASALDLGATAGGEIARAVDRVAASLRDRSEAQAEVRALATQARASAAVLGLAPLGFCALLATVEPAVPRLLLTTPVGWACLVGGLGLEAAGAAWMARIVAGAR